MAKVAFVLENDFEDSEFKVPYDRLTEAGHQVTVVGTEKGKEVTGKKGRETFTIEATTDMVDPGEFDALVVPGGYSPDKLRLDQGIVSFVAAFGRESKPVAAICHAGSLLVDADLVDGATLTSWPSIRVDLENAGAEWVDQEVVEDGFLITSRKPDDLPAFCDAILRRLA
jgi:protease I